MTRPRARSLWLAGPALIAACSSVFQHATPSTTASAPHGVVRRIDRQRPPRRRRRPRPAPLLHQHRAGGHAGARRSDAADPDRTRQQALPCRRRRARDAASGLHRRSQRHPASVADHLRWRCRAGPTFACSVSSEPVGISSTTATFLTGAIDPADCVGQHRSGARTEPDVYRHAVDTDRGNRHHPRLRCPADHGAGRSARLVGRGQRRRSTRHRQHQTHRLRVRQGRADVLRSATHVADAGAQPGRDRGQRRRCADEHRLRIRRRFARRLAGRIERASATTSPTTSRRQPPTCPRC